MSAWPCSTSSPTRFTSGARGAFSTSSTLRPRFSSTRSLDPEMLLLDEPMAGLGQEEIGRISALIRKVSVDRTILMVEHNLSVVADLSHTITVLTRGRILTEGDYAAVSKDPEVVEAYLGTGHA